MTDQISPKEIESLVALARQPSALKAAAEAHARDVVDRTARNERIKALDAQASIDWPAGQSAKAKAIAKVRAAEIALSEANAALSVANADAFNKSHAYTIARQSEETSLIAGCDSQTIAAWKNDLLNELTALGAPGVLITSQTVERSPVTRKEIRSGYSNHASVVTRMKAVRASYEEADSLKLLPDQRKLPAIIAEIRASWSAVDQNPGAKA